MNEIKPDTPNTSWDNVPHDIMVPVPIKIHPPVILDHSLPINHGPMPVPQTPLVCIFIVRKFPAIYSIDLYQIFKLSFLECSCHGRIY